MKIHILYLTAFLLLLFSGCKDNPVQVHEEHELTAELSLSSDHLHTLSEVTFTVRITDDHGETVTDMQLVEVQRKAHGDSEWRGTELSLSGDVYTGSYTFMSSGEYDLRVSGTRTGSDVEVLYEMEDHVEVARAHVETGNYRIEFENFPGHLHEGENGTVKFWVYEKEKNDAGERPPVAGLDTHIHCSNPDGTEEHHTAVTEETEGVYAEDHHFKGSGEAHMAFHFTAPDQSEVEVDFHVHIAGGH